MHYGTRNGGRQSIKRPLWFLLGRSKTGSAMDWLHPPMKAVPEMVAAFFMSWVRQGFPGICVL